MGYSITAETASKLDKHRAEGRLCGGATSSRAGCTVRAQYRVTSTSWVNLIGLGPSTERTMPMCTRHAKASPVGFRGVNFRVESHEKI